MRQYLTWKNGAIAALVIGVVILLCLLLFRRKEDPSIPILKEQQRQLEQLVKEQRTRAEEDRRRDSILKADFERSSRDRSKTLTYIIKERDEKIDRINSADFTNDSIRGAFADN